MLDIAIIGCGIVGAAAAYEFSQYRLSAAVFEKHNDVANGTTKANSAIIHAGYDPEPGTLMAKLNVIGSKRAKELCEKLDVLHSPCGSMVVAFSPDELPVLKRLYEQGIENGVEGMELLDRTQTLSLEPNLNEAATGALLAKSAMIVSPWEYAIALAETAVRNGVELHLQNEVKAITKIDGGWRLETEKGIFDARYVLNAAGLHSDAIHNMVAQPSFKIMPDRGEYYLLDKSEGGRVKHVIFQCPSREGKGTLVSPTVHGNLIVGPNNEQVPGKEDAATTSSGLSGILQKARKSVPSIDFRASIRNFSGIRAASDDSDFIVAEARGAKGFIDLAGIKSPGLSAAPAIASMAAELLSKSGLELIKKTNFIDTRKRLRFKELPAEEKAELVSKNPAYGRIVCRCETVTEGEILDAFAGPIPPRSVDAVKRRCNPGMGRCQGGFCGPRIVELLARQLKVSPTEILQDKAGTFILAGETKSIEEKDGSRNGI